MGRLKALRSKLSPLAQRVPQQTAQAFNDPDRASTTERGYGWAWQQLRVRILARDLHQCQECKRQGRLTAATQVDHIVEKTDGGDDAHANLQSLCANCHEAKTRAEKMHRRGAFTA